VGQAPWPARDARVPPAQYTKSLPVGHRLSLDRIAEASRTIDPVFLHTPQFISERLSARLSCRLTLKIETINPIGSFKGRGASYFINTFRQSTPLVCASAGNFGQAMAYVCRSHNIPLTIFASLNANPLKVKQMRALGCELKQAGEDFDAAKAAAALHAQQTGALFIEDGRIPEISEGAGSIAVELPPQDAILVPLGNGALLTGIARWTKAHSPHTQIIGVSSAHARAMHDSWKLNRIVEHETAHTIADGIAVRVPIPEAVADMSGIVDDVLLVEESSLKAAMKLLFEEERLIVEPSGAAGIAALLEHPALAQHGRIATILCGSNITQEQIRQWLTN
jgi:threonine dehydratase